MINKSSQILKTAAGRLVLAGLGIAVYIPSASAQLAPLTDEAAPRVMIARNASYQGVAPGAYTGSPGGAISNAAYNPYDRYCQPCRRGDFECKRLQRKYCRDRRSGAGTVGGITGYVGSSAGFMQGVPDGGGGYGSFGGGFGGISNSAAGATTFPGLGTATVNLGIPFLRSDQGNAIQARYMNAEANYQIQLYQWEVAKKTAEWQAMKDEQLRHEEEWNRLMQAKIEAEQARQQQAALAEEAKQQQAAEAVDAPGFAGSFFSIKNNQLIAPAPTEVAQAPAVAAAPIVKTPAQVEAQRPEKTPEQKASVLRQFKRSLFGI